MVHAETIIELLTEQMNAYQIDSQYTMGCKDGIKNAIELIKIADTINPFKTEKEAIHA